MLHPHCPVPFSRVAAHLITLICPTPDCRQIMHAGHISMLWPQAAGAAGGPVKALQPTHATANAPLAATNTLHDIDAAAQVRGRIACREL